MNSVVSLLRSLAGKIVVPRMEAKYRKFERQLAAARTVQRELLLAKIRRAAPSKFGRDHGFSSIRTVADFRRQVPIQGYDYYWPYVERAAKGDVTAMFPPGDKLLMYTLSSGTTANPKLIPINRVWMEEYRRGWQLWGIKAFLDHPKLFYAKLAGIAGNWDMRRTESGLPCGMASGLSARTQSPIISMMYSVPACVFEIDDPDAKYYLALRLAIVENAGMFTTATPATVVNFARLGDRYKETLVRDIADGTLTGDLAIPDRIRTELAKRLRIKHAERARELEAIIARTGRLYPRDYWDMSLVACWLGGTVGGYARHIPEYYGDVAQRDIGLLCSEGRFTIPIEDGTPAGVLEVASHYFEFVPTGEIDSPHPTVLECHELEVGKDYFVLPTTSCCLYRYHISDVLRCVGYHGEAPVVEFLNKGQRFSDMEGEKISEHQLVEAVASASQKLSLPIGGFTAVPIRPEAPAAPYYAIMIEEQDVAEPAAGEKLLRAVDDWLAGNNVMYQGKRIDRYLAPPRLIAVPRGTWAAYDRSEIQRRGVGEDHYKHPSLVLDPEFATRFPVRGEIKLPTS